MAGLRHRHAEAALELGLDRGELVALAFQASRLGEVQVDHEHGHEAALTHRRNGGQASSRSTWRVAYVSSTSPSLMSAKSLSTMPQSKPDATSRTSSLKRRRLAISPS